MVCWESVGGWGLTGDSFYQVTGSPTRPFSSGGQKHFRQKPFLCSLICSCSWGPRGGSWGPRGGSSFSFRLLYLRGEITEDCGDSILESGNTNSAVTETPAFPPGHSLSAFPVAWTTGQAESAQRFHEQCSLPFLLLMPTGRWRGCHQRQQNWLCFVLLFRTILVLNLS